MLWRFAAAVIVCALWSATCAADIIVSVGAIELLPNQTNQQVPIAVTETGGETVQGLNFRLRVGDGTGGPDYAHPGPKITSVDLIDGDTVFSLNHQDPTNVKTYSYSWAGSVTTASGSVTPDGVLALVTFDTTGVNAQSYAGPWSVYLMDRSGNKTDFAGITPTLVAGTVSITQTVPEAGTGVLLALAAGVAVVWRVLPRKRR
jgi:hypothetical protein